MGRGQHGSAYWQVLGLLSVRKFRSKAALAKAVVGEHGRPITRVRVRAIIADAVARGWLENPFEPRPQMARRRKR